MHWGCFLVFWFVVYVIDSLKSFNSFFITVLTKWWLVFELFNWFPFVELSSLCPWSWINDGKEPAVPVQSFGLISLNSISYSAHILAALRLCWDLDRSFFYTENSGHEHYQISLSVLQTCPPMLLKLSFCLVSHLFLCVFFPPKLHGFIFLSQLVCLILSVFF